MFVACKMCFLQTWDNRDRSLCVLAAGAVEVDHQAAGMNGESAGVPAVLAQSRRATQRCSAAGQRGLPRGINSLVTLFSRDAAEDCR